MRQSRPGRGAEQYPLRLPEGMRDQIKTRAEKNARSMNAEMIYLLSFSLDYFERVGEEHLGPIELIDYYSLMGEEAEKERLTEAGERVPRVVEAKPGTPVPRFSDSGIGRSVAQVVDDLGQIDKKVDHLTRALESFINLDALRADDELKLKALAERLGFEVRPKDR